MKSGVRTLRSVYSIKYRNIKSIKRRRILTALGKTTLLYYCYIDFCTNRYELLKNRLCVETIGKTLIPNQSNKPY